MAFKNWILFDRKEVFPGPLIGGSLSNLGQDIPTQNTFSSFRI